MKQGAENVNRILAFVVTPDEQPADYASCMAMRDIRLILPGVLKEAMDVEKAECPFTEENPAANAKFAKDMEEVCALITPNGNSVSSLHANLQRGMCKEDSDDSM